jgi:hypothetical protein
MTPIHTPQISVLLTKNSSRNIRVQVAPHTVIDLTPFLNEGSSVTTQKTLNSPNGGFTIRLGDQWAAAWGSSIYGLVEPMDAVEIRMSRVGKPVLVMRGMVTDITIDKSIGSDGKPSRNVTITGGDYGAFLRMIQIHSIRGQDISTLIATMSKEYLKEVYGIPNGTMPAGDFMTALTVMVINDHIANVGNPSLPQITDINTKGADDLDQVYMLGFQANPNGTMWSHIQEHGNLGPFYEMFFDDFETETALVYRKPPFKKLNKEGGSEFIFPASRQAEVETFTVKPNEITAIRQSRSEHDVSNFYYARAAKTDFFSDMDTILMSVMGDGSKLSTKDHPNCEQSVYGFRMMDINTNHGNTLEPGQDMATNKAGNSNLSTYMLQQIKYLQDCNVDNVVFESGTIRCAGRPEYKVGRYCEIDWGNGVKFTGYVVSVSHTYEPYKGYTCSLQFIRGTEYASATAADNPYFHGQGVYS